ncbi:MAG: biopolymer transporter ExbD [candidate division WOR-3 bacterium]|nr:biopolymer transporter ExbD [candidate division WOR-3 bacterium]
MNNQKRRNSTYTPKFISEMNITSLADVAINLMIIFLIAGISVALSRAGIPVSVPRSSAAVPQRTEGVTVTIDKQGKIYIEDKLINLAQFNSELNSVLAKKTTGQIYLIADEAVNYGLVITVLSKIREVGIGNVSLVASPQAIKKRTGK